MISKNGKKTFKVRAIGSNLVTDYDALAAGIRRFVGRKFIPEEQAWAILDEPVIIPDCAEYRAEIAAGALEVIEDPYPFLGTSVVDSKSDAQPEKPLKRVK